MAIQSAKQITPGIEISPGGTLDITAAKVLLRIQNKTANYTVLETDSGTIFQNRGDTGAIEYTLPTNPKNGLFFIFVSAVDQSMTITAPDEKLVAYNDLTADGTSFVTGSHKIGSACLVFADGTMWYALALTAHTQTVVSA